MGTQKTRSYKIDWIMLRVKAASDRNRIINEEKLIAKFVIFFSSSRVTAHEILKSLEGANKIVRSFGEIWTPKAYKKFGRRRR